MTTIPPTRAVLFDFDGTLTLPGGIDFGVMRRRLGCPEGTYLLEFIAALPDPEQRRQAGELLLSMELEFAAASRPNDGAEELIRELRRRGLALGILTRNALAAITLTLRNFRQVSAADFAVIVTRDNGLRPKPHPDGVQFAAERFPAAPAEVLVVGDFQFDIEAGQAAGARTAYLSNQRPLPAFRRPPDHIIGQLAELLQLLPAAAL